MVGSLREWEQHNDVPTKGALCALEGRGLAPSWFAGSWSGGLQSGRLQSHGLQSHGLIVVSWFAVSWFAGSWSGGLLVWCGIVYSDIV